MPTAAENAHYIRVTKGIIAKKYRNAYGLGPIDYVTRWGVISYWKLNEASGTRSDTIGTNHLTDNNSVGQAAGKVSATSAQFIATSNEYLSRVDNASLSTGDVDFWIACWVYLDSLGSSRVWAEKGSNGAFEWYLEKNASQQPTFFIFNPAGASLATVLNSTVLTTGQWYFVIAYHDSVNNEVGISLDGSTFTTSIANTPPTDGIGGFEFGRDGSSPSQNHDGRLNAVVFGKSPPGGIGAKKTEIRDILYNSGNGIEYPWSDQEAVKMALQGKIKTINK